MASIAIMIGGEILNAAAFIGGNATAKVASGDSGKAALEEKKRHDKALEDYQKGYNKYVCERTQLLDWIDTNEQIKREDKQELGDTDRAFELYNRVYPDKPVAP